MSKVTIAIPFKETVWGEILLTINLPEEVDQGEFVDAVKRGDTDVFTQNVIAEDWRACDSEVIEIEYDNLEVIQ